GPYLCAPSLVPIVALEAGSEGGVHAGGQRAERRAADVGLRGMAVAVSGAEARLGIPPLVLREDERVLRAQVQPRAARADAVRQRVAERVAQRDVADAHERAVDVIARAGEGAEAVGARPRIGARLVLGRPVIRRDLVEPTR